MDFAKAFDDRREAMAQAYLSGSYTLREIAYFHVHYATVSRAVRRDWQLRTEPRPAWGRQYLAVEPELFARLLGIHTGAIPARQLGLRADLVPGAA